MSVVRQFQLSLISLAALLGVGVLGYHLIEGLGWFDSLYMTVITLTTVGFGEVKPLSNAGRAFTVAMVLVGVGVAMWFLRNLVEVVVGEELRDLLGRWKMERKVGAMEGHFIICGHGRIGREVAAEFVRHKVPFVVVERNPDVVGQLREATIGYQGGGEA